MRVLLILLALSVPVVVAGCAEKETAFEGRVLDRDTRAPIAGAQVEASRAGTDVATAMTDGEGRYKIVLTPGTWALEASAPGYEGSEMPNLALDADETKAQDFYLARGT